MQAQKKKINVISPADVVHAVEDFLGVLLVPVTDLQRHFNHGLLHGLALVLEPVHHWSKKVDVF